jgi:hypothetical protein
MAPEQVLGSTVGPRADLYTLGVVLHELLSGSVPFSGGSALGVLHRHLNEAPLPLRQVRPEVPEPLEALVLRLLAKDPLHRPADAQEVYLALAPLLPGPAAPGVPAFGGPMDPTRPFRHPSAPWLQARRSPLPPTRREDVAGAVDEARRLLAEGRVGAAVQILGRALPVAAAVHGEDSVVVRMLRKQYAATLMEDGQFRLALPELQRLAEQRAAEAGPTDPQLLRLRADAAHCLAHL